MSPFKKPVNVFIQELSKCLQNNLNVSFLELPGCLNRDGAAVLVDGHPRISRRYYLEQTAPTIHLRQPSCGLFAVAAMPAVGEKAAAG